MKKLKGIIIVVFLALASLMMPFNIYAAGETIIVPTYQSSSTSSEWSSKIKVSNYCEGTNANTNSCILSFDVVDTANGGNYYGYISFDGYAGTTRWIDYRNVYIAGGHGEFRYNFYQNGVIQINAITIQAVNLLRPETTVDLSQIISILTAIENDTTFGLSYLDEIIDNQESVISQIQTVIADLVISNGYLDTLTKIRQWNIPIESYDFVFYNLKRYQPVSYQTYNYIYNLPEFNVSSNSIIYSCFLNAIETNFNHGVTIVIRANVNLSTKALVEQYFNIQSPFSIENYKYLNYSNSYYTVRFDVVTSSNGYWEPRTSSSMSFIPIYAKYTGFNKDISTDFALQFELSNRLLDNLDLIANGNSGSNQANQQLDSNTSQFQTDSNDLIDIEDTMSNNMDSAMQQITPSSNPGTSFGGNFLTSAVWVRTQFERLTNGNPFGSLIVYGLTLGLALLLLGKVFL